MEKTNEAIQASKKTGKSGNSTKDAKKPAHKRGKGYSKQRCDYYHMKNHATEDCCKKQCDKKMGN